MTPPTRDISHRTVWALAGPMIISNISVPLVGAVDTAVVGHLPGLHHIGAVALGALIFSFIYWGFGFLKMGITGFIARAYGADDQDSISGTMLRFILLGIVLGLAVIMLGNPLVGLALYLIDSSEAVETLASEYALIRVWGAPATLCVYVFTGIFVGMHQTHLALILQLVLNLTNVALDLLFVPILEWGVPGVAWATLIAEYSAALCGFFLLRKPLLRALDRLRWSDVFEAGALRAMASTNGNIFIRTICLVFSFAFFTAQSAAHGELILAVNTVLLHFQTVMAYGLDGFAHAVEAMGGSAYGARNRARFKRAAWLTTLWSGGMAALVSVVYLLFGNWFVSLFTDADEVIRAADQYLIWMVISPLVSCWSFQLDGLFIGTGHAREMRNAMIVSTAGYLILVIVFQAVYGNHGLFIGLTGFMILRAFTLYYYYPKLVRSIA